MVFTKNNAANFGRLQFSNHMESIPAPPAAPSPRCIYVYPTQIANNVGGRAVSGEKAFKLMDLAKYYWIIWPQTVRTVPVSPSPGLRPTRKTACRLLSCNPSNGHLKHFGYVLFPCCKEIFMYNSYLAVAICYRRRKGHPGRLVVRKS